MSMQVLISECFHLQQKHTVSCQSQHQIHTQKDFDIASAKLQFMMLGHTLALLRIHVELFMNKLSLLSLNKAQVCVNSAEMFVYYHPYVC